MVVSSSPRAAGRRFTIADRQRRRCAAELARAPGAGRGMRLSTDQMRALRLLDEAEPRGCTEAILLAHGFTRELLAGLVHDGLASKRPESVSASWRSVAVARLRITDAGRRALRPTP
jgi:hypothetical protein